MHHYIGGRGLGKTNKYVNKLLKNIMKKEVDVMKFKREAVSNLWDEEPWKESVENMTDHKIDILYYSGLEAGLFESVVTKRYLAGQSDIMLGPEKLFVNLYYEGSRAYLNITDKDGIEYPYADNLSNDEVEELFASIIKDKEHTMEIKIKEEEQ